MPGDSAPTQLSSGSVGTLVCINSPVLTEMISFLGFNFLFLDLEHGEISERGLANHVMAAKVPILARLVDCSERSIKLAVDSGVWGIVVPHVQSASMAQDIVRWAKYAPVGQRSVGLSRNTVLGYELGAALQETRVPHIVAQIEDAAGASSAEEICGTAAVDSVFIGPYDLSVSLGTPGDFGARPFLDAVATVVKAAHGTGVSVGVYAPSPAAWVEFREQGCDYVVLRSDSLFLSDGAAKALKDIREI